MISRVSERGQVVIPKPLRDRLGIRTGQRLEFREERGRLIATKAASDSDPLEDVYGILELGRSTDATISKLRGKAGGT
jgi:AbrB family looped-hinge helix DNA binding protein